MPTFAELKTGLGTGASTLTYYGPFENSNESDGFVARVRREAAKLLYSKPMQITIVDELPQGRAAVSPDSFLGFMQLKSDEGF